MTDDDLPITRREMREFLDDARNQTVGIYGQPLAQAIFELFAAKFPETRPVTRPNLCGGSNDVGGSDGR